MTTRHRPSPEEISAKLQADFARRLAVLRKHLRHTPETFAAAIGYSTRRYLAWERNQRKGQAHAFYGLIVALHNVCGVSLDWLMFGEARGHRSKTPLGVGGKPLPRSARLRVVQGGAA